MNTELTIKVEGSVKIIDNIEEVASHYKGMIEAQNPESMNTDEDFEKGKDFIKNLEKIQEQIKNAEKSLFNDDMERVKNLLDDLNKTCASTKTQFKKAIDVRKSSLIDKLICDNENRRDVELEKLEYQKYLSTDNLLIDEECKKAFKGKSSLKIMEDLAKEITNEIIAKDNEKNDRLKEIINAYKVQYESMEEIYSKEQGIKDCVRYLNEDRDADFVKNDLFRIITEIQQERRDIEEIKRKEEEAKKQMEEERLKREKEEQEKLNLENQKIQEDVEQENFVAESIKNNEENLENEKETCYNEGINIPKKDTYFKVKFKEIGEHTQIVIFTGQDKYHLAKCGQIAMRNNEFADFKCMFPANEYIDINQEEI